MRQSSVNLSFHDIQEFRRVFIIHDLYSLFVKWYIVFEAGYNPRESLKNLIPCKVDGIFLRSAPVNAQ